MTNDVLMDIASSDGADLSLDEIETWAEFAQSENKAMGMAPAQALRLVKRLRDAERDRDHYRLSADIEAREVDRKNALFRPVLDAARAIVGGNSDTERLRQAVEAYDAGAVETNPAAPLKWKTNGLRQRAPNGTAVGVIESVDGEAYLFMLDVPCSQERPAFRTTVAITGGTLATMMILIAKQGGLWIPGVGTLRVTETGPAIGRDALAPGDRHG
ncbi:hypothetical protein K7G19_19705 [Cupriavidus sp. DB3]|uniref:hypothetical protein n=1 Tax=Cupriavidus sp. DB3 TaxID=2873259 RepID=UPI001CF45EB9|nr:hypothetical protein [Cupriavidus sp. DB3]MCA7085818.1 hypothetical protein [Cupriavidus sp. DB3]